MKKFVLQLLFLLPVCVFSQSHSWDGNGIRSDEKIHYLNIFVNIIYDVHPECNDRFQNEQYWPPVSDPALEGINNAAIPTYLLDWMDTVYVPGHLHGSCTRLYGESSFDSLQITGDFIVVNLKESTVLGHGVFKDYNIKSVAMEMISANAALTLFGQKRADNFNATNVLIRNITRAYGGINPGSGSGGRNTLQCVGDGNFAENPTNIVTHEISHGLFGYNNFHTSGGNHRYPDFTVMSFLNIQGGYGLMGAANSGLVGCNGYERWRMHWKHPEAVGYIAARNAANTESVVSDISVEDGNKSFLLRDFMTYGDAVRIKLPYKDSETSSNQYIWLENHKVGSNNKLDFLQYSNTAACRPQGAAGVYAYYQVGRDVLEGTSLQVWDNFHRDNLRIISAEGFHDYTKETDTYNLQCVAYGNQSYTLRRGAANPFGGYNDLEKQIVPADEDTLLYVAKELAPWRIVVEGENRDDIPFLGDNHDAFTSYTRLNMGTNPSTCNTRTFHSNNASYSSFISARQPQLNTRTTYISGLSIELVPVAGTGDFIVNVSWDDYEVAGAVRWTGDVALKDTAVLAQGSAVTLAQNMTVAQDRRDQETGLFAGRTRFTVESGAYLRQDSASTLSLTESSSMTVDAGAKYELSLGATLHVGAGCMVAFSPDAVVTLKGTVEVDSGGVLTVYDTVGLGRAARLIIRPGGKLIVDGGTLTSACASEMWQGIEVVGNPERRQFPQFQGTEDDEVMAPTKSAKMQPKGGYESFFGNNTWEYNIYYRQTCFTDDYDPNLFNACCMTETFKYHISDTLRVLGKSYYNGKALYSAASTFLREDTLNGRLYARYSSNEDEFLLCDMSLSEGDTFTIPSNSVWNNYYDDGINMIVDSVTSVSGRKVIHLTWVSDYYVADPFYESSNDYLRQYNVTLRFMEGVGPIYGICPTSFVAMEITLPLLLCMHKDDTLAYMTHEDLGCYQSGSDVPEYPSEFLKLYPNPSNGMLNIVLETQKTVGGRAVIRDVTGRVVRSLAVLDRQTAVDVSDLTPGLYILTFIDNDSRSVSRKFLKK